MQIPSDRNGFALPAAILVIAVLTASVAGAFALTSSERRVIDNLTEQQEAFAVAQTALESFLVNRADYGFAANPPAAVESTQISVQGGDAIVVLRRLRPAVAGSPNLYVIRAEGMPTDQSIAGTPAARRTVAQLARWQPGSMAVRAGWTSLTGLRKNGTAGTLSGVDNCGDSTALAGVAVADPPGFSDNGNFEPTGDPPVQDLGEPEEAVDSVNIDWEGIKNQTAFTPDVVYPDQAWPSFADPGYWPVIFVDGNLSLPSSGRGILIVTGNLTINGGTTWDGIVLVGLKLTSNGNNTVYGAVYTGLEVLTSPDANVAASEIGENSVGNGQKIYQYDSCAVAAALAAYGTLQVYENAWMDNWQSW